MIRVAKIDFLSTRLNSVWMTKVSNGIKFDMKEIKRSTPLSVQMCLF